MDEECQKLLNEKDELIRELQEKIKELEMKIKSYEIREVYRGILPDEVLEELVKLPPDQMVIEIGKYLKERESVQVGTVKERNEKIAKIKEVEKIKVETETKKDTIVNAKVGVDLNFTQRYDHEGSDVAFLAEDLMRAIGIEEGSYVEVKKDGSVNLKVIPYSKEGFIIVPTWVREKIGAKVNDYVEVVRK